MNFDFDDFLFLGKAVAIVSVCITLVIGAGIAAGSSQCKQFGKRSQVETTYEFPSGCFVKVDGQFIPRETWRVVK